MSVSSTIVGDHEPVQSEKASASSKPLSSYTLRKLPWQTYITPFEHIVAESYPGSGTEEDPYIIDWIHEDAEDPQRWPLWYRWVTIAIVSWTTLAVALSSSAYSGGIKPLIIEFGASQELLIAGVSLFVVGFAFGPLLWAPLSEVYGRRNVFIVSYFFLTVWTIACAVSQTVAQLMVFRFLCGFFGSSPLANAGGVITDVLNAKQRGLGMALFAAAPFLGPALGPITGGFLGDSAGWRWIEGFLAIFCGVILILLIVACPETYAPTLLRRRADKLSKATGKVYRVPADRKAKLQLGPLFAAALSRPWKFLIFEPIVSILTIYTAVLYGILYLNFAAYPIIFQQQRGWSAGIGGLAFLGILVGTVLSIIVSVVCPLLCPCPTALGVS
jgi:multidrug resistance protein